MHHLHVDESGITLDGLPLPGVTQLVIHMQDGRSFAHLTLPVDLHLDAPITDVRLVRDGHTRQET